MSPACCWRGPFRVGENWPARGIGCEPGLVGAPTSDREQRARRFWGRTGHTARIREYSSVFLPRPGSLPRAEDVQLDWRVLFFALGVSLLSSLSFALAPALRAPAREAEGALRGAGRSLGGSTRRLHSGFVVAEVALAVVLMVSAGILGRTLLRLSSLDPGFNTRTCWPHTWRFLPLCLRTQRKRVQLGRTFWSAPAAYPECSRSLWQTSSPCG